jgi:anti-sigma regulatory factor (Ser/Thr protein kinase)
MTQEPAHALWLDVPCDHHAAVTVRQALRETDGIGGSLWEALLVGSELVTNAVLHSGGASDHILEVRADLRRGRLLISVHDPGISGHPAQPRQTGSGLGGWGLRIVEQLAERWGSERPDGYRVWAELRLGPG